MKKLTLSADEEVIAAAHRIAEERGTSISAMFSRFIKSLASAPSPEKIGRITHRASGLIELPNDKSDSDVLTDALLQKHGLDH